MKELLVPVWIWYLLSCSIIGIIVKITLHWRDVKGLKNKVKEHDCILEDIKKEFHNIELKLESIHTDIQWLKKNGR